MRALSIRQPDAEAIMRGIKKIEYRYGLTKVRERIYIYAGFGRYSQEEEAKMLAEYGIADITSDDLPRGVLIGTVELFDCTTNDGSRYEWHVRNPERATEPLKPTKHQKPVWFNPF